MSSNNVKVPEVTKTIVKHLHGKKNVDIKIWGQQFKKDNTNTAPLPEIPIESPKRTFFKKTLSRPSIYAVSVPIVILFTAIVLRPDLFPFLDYHNIYRTTSKVLLNTPKTPETYESSSLSTKKNTYQPVSKPIVNKTYKPVQKASYSRPTPRIYSKVVGPPMLNNFSRISLTGKVFSWKDKKGTLHFSNTNFPFDNKTLQVQTEINTYHKVTKVHILGNSVFVPVTLSNNGRSTTLQMLLDTGCSHTVVPYIHLNYLNAKYGSKIVSTLADGSKTVGREAYIDLMQVGSRRERNVTLSGAKVAGSRNSGLLGMDFLKNNSFKIDFDSGFIVWM